MSVNRLVFPTLSYTGWGARKEVVHEVEKYKPNSILVITDSILEEIGVVEKVVAPLKEHGYDISIYTDIEPEPSLQCGQTLVDFARQGKYDLVIGLGGGSAIDLAKLAAVVAPHEGDVKDYLNLTGSKQLTNRGLPKILIPTTSGTGSEVTNISVLSLETTKDVVTDDLLIADVAIIDPELTVTMPAKVTAATGVDALTHAIEAFLSVNRSETSDALAIQAVRKIIPSLKRAVENGNDKEARTDMSIGSYLAGLAFFNAGVGGVHALAYPLGGQFKLAHGESNAVLLPYVMEYIRDSCHERLAYLYSIITEDFAIDAETAAEKFVAYLQELVKEVGIPETLQQFSIPETAIDSLTDDAVKQTRLLARSPKPLERADIYQIYKNAYEGKI